jgi:HNH endonuclease
MNNIQDLPSSENLDISTFSRLLDDKTNSYKILFLLSILDILSCRFFKADSSIPLKELAVEMLVNAWYPHSVFHLSFGLQDLVTSNLDRLELKLGKSFLEITEGNKSILRNAIENEVVNNELTRYVPFRLLRPFFKELSGLQDHKVNIQIKTMSEQTFETRKPLYKFDQNSTAIIIHPEWALYIRNNYKIIQGWILWEWLKYMQKNNPNTPAIVNKIFPPVERESLQSQTSYWKTIIEKCSDFRCIYSGQSLILDDLSLDHYLPWSFVAHDQPWNLIPVPGSINSSKSDKIPSDTYLEGFIKTQHLGLSMYHGCSSTKKWNNYIESYIVDLGFSSGNDLLDFNKLRKQYKLKIEPLIALAVSQGFENEWIYRKTC